MATPVFGAITTSLEGTDVTSHDVSYVSGISAGDLIIVAFTVDANPTCTWPDGWTNIVSTANGSDVRHEVKYKVASGSESGSFIITTSSAQHSAHACMRIADAQVASGAASSTGTSSVPNPPNCNVGVSGDYLFITTVGMDNRYALGSDYQPSSYTARATVKSHASNTADSCFTYVATRALTASSADPGVFNSDNEEQYVATTFAIEEAGGTDVTVNASAINIPFTVETYTVSTTRNVDFSPSTINIPFTIQTPTISPVRNINVNYAFTPDTAITANLKGWFDGSDATTLFDATVGGSNVVVGGTVARWEDKSGLGNHATQTTSGSRPILATQPITGVRNIWLYTEPADGTGYYTASNLTFQVGTNLPSFANEIYYGDASVTRDLRQLAPVISGVRYTLSFYIKMDDNSVPNSGTGNYRDITLTINNSDIFPTNSAWTMESLGGNIYRSKFTFTSTGSTSIFIRKYGSTNSNKPLTVSGIQLERSNFATNYQKVTNKYNVSESGVTSVKTPFFDGTDDYMIADALAALVTGSNHAHTIFIVQSPFALTSGMAPYCLGRLTTDNYPLDYVYLYPLNNRFEHYRRADVASPTSMTTGFDTPLTYNQEILTVAYKGSTGVDLYKNNKLGGTGTTNVGTLTLDGFTIGAFRRSGSLQNYWNGRIQELIFFDRELTSTEIDKVNQYLAFKWGINLLNIPSTLNAPTVSVARNINFSPSAINVPFTLVSPTISTTRHVDFSGTAINIPFTLNAVTVSPVRNIDVSQSVNNIPFTIESPTTSTTRNVNISQSVLSIPFTVESYSVSTIRNINYSANSQNIPFTVESSTISTTRNINYSSDVQNIPFTVETYTASAIRNINYSASAINIPVSVVSGFSVITDISITVFPNVSNITFVANPVSISSDSGVTVNATTVSLPMTINAVVANVNEIIDVNTINLPVTLNSATISTTRNVDINTLVIDCEIIPRNVEVKTGTTINAPVINIPFTLNSASVRIDNNKTLTNIEMDLLLNPIGVTVTRNSTNNISVQNISANLLGITVSGDCNVSTSPLNILIQILNPSYSVSTEVSVNALQMALICNLVQISISSNITVYSSSLNINILQYSFCTITKNDIMFNNRVAAKERRKMIFDSKHAFYSNVKINNDFIILNEFKPNINHSKYREIDVKLH